MAAKYKIGDIVELNGYSGRLFKINGYSELVYYYRGELIREVKYVLIDLSSKEKLIGFEEDITLKEENNNDEQRLQKIHKMIDEYLFYKREYEDYMWLYKMFGDKEDKEVALISKELADKIMRRLKNNEIK